MRNLRANSSNRTTLLIFLGIFATVGITITLLARAAGTPLAFEPEAGTLTAPATVISDTAASGTGAVKFAQPATPGSCPAGQTGSPPNCTTTSTSKPISGGYLQLQPVVGVAGLASLPNDSKASGMVHYSTWEPRPENTTPNHTVPPATFTTAGYSGIQNHAALFGRVTGNFTGTTDEIIQWAAAKWGLPDEVIRADAVTESFWYQAVRDSAGKPIQGKGYGDFGSCGGSPAPSGYGVNGPASFGLMQDKWCAFKDPTASGYDGWPYSETSTAYNLDLYGAVIRGCYEGWDTWLGNGYTSGDLYGCLGRWFSGAWHTTDAENYITSVKTHYTNKEWLTW
jgi:hypothetical protein